MKPGDLIRRRIITDLTNQGRITGTVIRNDGWVVEILWNDGYKILIPRDDLEELYEVVG